MSTIDGQVEEYRQTVLIAAARNAVFNAAFKKLKNRRGALRLFVQPKTNYVALASKFKVQQMFIKVPSASVRQSHEVGARPLAGLHRLLHGKHAAKPGRNKRSAHRAGRLHAVLQVEAVTRRLSKKLKASNLEYLPCHESNTAKQMTFARQQFHAGAVQGTVSGAVPILVTTTRLLFFKRYLLRGASKIFLLQPPEYPQLYKDFVRMVDRSRSNTIVCYYTKYHATQLEPIVGADKIAKLVQAPDSKITQFH